MTVKRQFRLVPSIETGDKDFLKKSILVAFASSDINYVNEHFGTASRFVIYRISASEATLEKVCEFDHANKDGNEDKLGPRLEALSGCNAIYCTAVGASAVRLLIKRGIYPSKQDEIRSIHELVDSIQDSLTEGVQINPIPGLVWTGKKRVGTALMQALLEDEWVE
ncbi:MAG: nitrogen fixation protein NifX [Magnetococcales bacterium]|nr:nitrogen fixation protein NifX [Magnetococcales bacterium]